ncbi:MAG: diguanylate cyclase [Deltaproteobacteria bacterium]|nr:diguanylate cyclase [Deltaproteobacteria bacterium]
MSMALVLACSVALQLTAAILALRLIRLTGQRMAWGLISAAMCLMAARRIVPLYHVVTGDATFVPDPLTEWIGVLLSVFMVVGMMGIAPFFSAARRAEVALRESEATLKTIFSSVDSGILLIDSATHTIVDINPAAARLFGAPREDIVGSVCHRYICPAEGGKCPITDLRQKVDNAERLLIKADGNSSPIIKTVTPVRFGERDYLLESITDVTQLKETEKRLRESERKFRSAFEDSRDAFYITTLEGRFLDFNRAFLELFGHSQEEMAALNIADIYEDPADLEDFRKAIGRDGSVRDYGVILHKKDGRRMECLITASARYADDGGISGYQGIVRDITRQKELEEELRNLSLVDDLTGLYNRRGFSLLSQQQIKVAERSRKELLLFFADLDNMKQINDTLGHTEGDKALMEVAAVLKEAFRESDIIGRIGGDEFAVLALDATDVTREALMKRLGDLVEARNAGEGRRYELSLSIGIARYRNGDHATLEALMTKADALMYEDKRRKQNPAG